MLGLGYLFLRAINRDLNLEAVTNPFTLLFVIYLFFVAAQVSVAAFIYGQSILDGIIAIRHQFYFLSFFLFLFLLNDLQKIKKFLDLLSVVAIILVVLGIINYFGPTIFYHRWADGWGTRAGITRAYLPGMDLVTLALLWHSCKWISATDPRTAKVNGFLSLILLGAHFFRQTRSRIVSVTLVLMWWLISKRRYKQLGTAAIIGAILVGVAQLTMEDNIFIEPFTSSAEEYGQTTGTWAVRVRKSQEFFEIFREHPLVGSGTVAIRIPDDGTVSRGSRIFRASMQGDLGYAVWLKAYGLVGMTWLFVFFYLMWLLARRSEKLVPEKFAAVPLFSRSYVYFVIISNVTLNHLMTAEQILLVSLCTAIIVQSLNCDRSR